jgi:putative oxidoreductase
MGSNGDTMMGSIGLLVLRLGAAGVLFLAHGLPKITNIAQGAKTFPDPLHIGSAMSFGLVVFAEGVCTLFVALGLFTRFALLPIMGFLCVAFFIHHAPDPFRQKELALVFLVSFVTLFFTGPGKFALDSWIGVRVGKQD